MVFYALTLLLNTSAHKKKNMSDEQCLVYDEEDVSQEDGRMCVYFCVCVYIYIQPLPSWIYTCMSSFLGYLLIY